MRRLTDVVIFTNSFSFPKIITTRQQRGDDNKNLCTSKSTRAKPTDLHFFFFIIIIITTAIWVPSKKTDGLLKPSHIRALVHTRALYTLCILGPVLFPHCKTKEKKKTIKRSRFWGGRRAADTEDIDGVSGRVWKEVAIVF